MTDESSATDGPRTDAAFLSIPLKTVALGCGLLTVASLTALVVLASTQGDDALATTALVMAVVAFIVQILLYLAQAAQGVEQRTQAQEIHAETRALLVRLEAHGQAQRAMLVDQYNKVLDAVVQAAKETGKETTARKGAAPKPFDEAAFEKRLMEKISKLPTTPSPMFTPSSVVYPGSTLSTPLSAFSTPLTGGIPTVGASPGITFGKVTVDDKGNVRIVDGPGPDEDNG